jgi:hypothetical protein
MTAMFVPHALLIIEAVIDLTISESVCIDSHMWCRAYMHEMLGHSFRY